MGLSNAAYSAAAIPELGSVYNPAKQYEIAKQLIDQPGSGDNFNAGVKWLKLAAAQQFPEALYQLGFYHEFGVDGIQQDMPRAVSLYEKAAEQHHLAAQFNLSALLLREDSPVRDLQKGRYWLEQAAEQEDPKSQYSLAMLYEENYFQEGDEASRFAQAMNWLERSARNGYKEAQYTLGTYYLGGERLPHDNSRAFHWFEKAAQQGDAPSQYNIALMYELGEGVEADTEQAVYWYKQAADQREPGALFNLGRKYLLGQGLEKKVDEGLDMIIQSAEAGNPAAQTLLANHFLIRAVPGAGLCQGLSVIPAGRRKWLSGSPVSAVGHVCQGPGCQAGQQAVCTLDQQGRTPPSSHGPVWSRCLSRQWRRH
ncbi:MAG: tetratricopeptide repeat protein [Thiolinea sp.]